MIRAILVGPAFLLLILLTNIRCRRHNDMTTDSTLTGVLVDAPSCSHFVVKVLEGKVADSDVVASWTDSATHISYSNVFTVRNWIQFSLAKISVGDTFSFSYYGYVPILDPYETCAIFPFAMPSASDNVVNPLFLSGPH